MLYFKTSPENAFKKSAFSSNNPTFTFNHNPSQFNKKKDEYLIISEHKQNVVPQQTRQKRTVRQLKETVCGFI